MSPDEWSARATRNRNTAYLLALRGMDSATRLEGLLATLEPKESR